MIACRLALFVTIRLILLHPLHFTYMCTKHLINTRHNLLNFLTRHRNWNLNPHVERHTIRGYTTAQLYINVDHPELTVKCWYMVWYHVPWLVKHISIPSSIGSNPTIEFASTYIHLINWVEIALDSHLSLADTIILHIRIAPYILKKKCALSLWSVSSQAIWAHFRLTVVYKKNGQKSRIPPWI